MSQILKFWFDELFLIRFFFVERRTENSFLKKDEISKYIVASRVVARENHAEYGAAAVE